MDDALKVPELGYHPELSWRLVLLRGGESVKAWISTATSWGISTQVNYWWSLQGPRKQRCRVCWMLGALWFSRGSLGNRIFWPIWYKMLGQCKEKHVLLFDHCDRRILNKNRRWEFEVIQQALNILIQRLLKDFKCHPCLLAHRTDIFQPHLQRWISTISRGY